MGLIRTMSQAKRTIIIIRWLNDTMVSTESRELIEGGYVYGMEKKFVSHR